MVYQYIAINDGVDTFKSENELMAFKNIFNDWYARDTSKKIRAVFKAKGQSGKHLSNPIYGYKHSETDKNLWVIDDEAAEVVRKIFHLCIDGYGPAQIARILTEEGIPTPTAYALSQGRDNGHKNANLNRWGMETISGILEKPEYAGHTVNFRTHVNRNNSCSLFDISSGKVKQSGRVISGLNACDCMIPFVHNNSYYYLTQIYGNWNIYRTIQAIPAESLTSDQSIPLSSKSEDILCATSSEDGVYYLSSDLNYCKLNLDRINNSGAENMDDEVLIRGDIIENNASNYLSKSSSQLQYVSDSCFIAFDESDRTIKIVGQLPTPSEKNQL